MIKSECRYIDPEGVCILENKVCNNCRKRSDITYTAQYDVFKGITTVTISERGRRLVSCDIYGQLSGIAVREYALDLCRILYNKGVIA